MHPENNLNIAPGFLKVLIWIAILGSLALIVGNIVGSIVVPGHDWVADTVSDLAAGRYEIIQDVSLYAFAGSLTALALAAAHIHDGRPFWSVFVFALVTLALCVTVIAARNEYGDGDAEGIVIHIYVVYAMGALFTLAFGLLGWLGQPFGAVMRRISWACCAFWAVGAPVFFMLPTAYDGAFERALGVASAVWVVSFAASLRRACAAPQ